MQYSEKYYDEGEHVLTYTGDSALTILFCNTIPCSNSCLAACAVYEYRHVVLPSDIAALLPKGRLLSEVWTGHGGLLLSSASFS